MLNPLRRRYVAGYHTGMATQPESGGAREVRRVERIEEPAKLIRIGTMASQLLDELRQAPLDQPSRVRLREIYQTSLREVVGGVSEDLEAEIGRMLPTFVDGDAPTESELRVAHAQLSGWLEGLFRGLQTLLMAQQRENAEDQPSFLPGRRHPEPARGLYL
jgi:hypothetical protein